MWSGSGEFYVRVYNANVQSWLNLKINSSAAVIVGMSCIFEGLNVFCKKQLHSINLGYMIMLIGPDWCHSLRCLPTKTKCDI